MKDEVKADLLKEEYLFLEKLYEDTDGKAHTIKGWSITVAIAAIGTGILNTNKIAFLLGIVSSVVFWLLEGYWRSFTHYYAKRIQQIEEAFRKEALDEIFPLQIYSTWQKTHEENEANFWNYVFRNYVLWPHLAFAGASLLLFCLSNG